MVRISLRFLNILFLLLLGASVSWSWVLNAQDLAGQPRVTASEQLGEIQQAFKPEYVAYVGAGWMYLPLPTQGEFQSEWGTHQGFPFRHKLSLWLTNPLDSTSLRLGLLGWVERQGWDHEDFLAYPRYGRFAKIQSVITTGMTLSDSSTHWGVGGGVQYFNPEYVGESQTVVTDTLSWWGLAQWGPLALTTRYHNAEWKEWRLNLDFQARSARGQDSVGWKTYLPDLEVLARSGSKDSLRFSWNQNLYGQIAYLKTSFWLPDRGLSSAILRLTPEPSQLLTLDVTCTRTSSGRVFYGGGIQLPFLRVAYNHASDYENFFGARGLWVVEFRLDIGSAEGKFFALGAPRSVDTIKETHETKETKHPDHPTQAPNGFRQESSATSEQGGTSK